MTRKQKPQSPLYRCWANMVQRTENPKCKNFAQYGGRGIRMSERWRGSYEAFAADMGEPPPGMSLDRIDVNGAYRVENCRWATPKQQMRNTQRTVWVEVNGVRMSLADACDELGRSRQSVLNRIHRGESVIQALTAPPCPKDNSLRKQAKRAGLSSGTVFTRLERGWTVEDALSTPAGGRWYDIDGLTLRQQAKKAGISYATVKGRIYKGWSLELALSTPPLHPDYRNGARP